MSSRAAPRIFLGGRVVSPGLPVVSAVAVVGSTIDYVGDDRTCRQRFPGAQVHELRGRLVTPAFVDAHLHAIQTGLTAAGLDLHGIRSRAAVLDRVAEFASGRPAAGLVFGQGWDEHGWADPRPPTRTELDQAAPGLAVYLARVDVHSAVVSSTLLQRLPGVEQARGFRPDGLLSQEAHHRCRAAMHGLHTDEERRAAARSALQAAAAQGVATVHELGGPHLGPIEDLARVSDAGREVGVDVVTYWGELASAAVLDRARLAGAQGLAGDLCIDGAIGSHTAALIEPYADQPSRGTRYLSDEEISDHLLVCTQAGVQAGFHCIGDDAVAAAVEGLRHAAERLGHDRVRRARHRLEHVEMASRNDLAALADLGVVASMQPAFDASWGRPGELYELRLGRRRARGMNALGSLQRAGVQLAFGTDAPVTPVAGWEMVRAAVRHTRAEERLSVADALLAATVGGHRAARDGAHGRHAGTLRAGEAASFSVWDLPAELAGADGLPALLAGDPLPRCVATLAAGRIIHSDESFAG